MTLIKCLQAGLLIFGLTFSCVSTQTWPCQWKESIYVEGSCFLYYNTTQKTYAKAKLYCEGLGGVLASVSSTKQVNYNLSSLLSGSETWIGADNKTGTWIWLSTGRTATELDLFWASGEPSLDPVNMCAYILNSKAYNGYCGDSWNFLCMEINLATTTAANPASTLTGSQTAQTTFKPDCTTDSGPGHLSVALLLLPLCIGFLYVII